MTLSWIFFSHIILWHWLWHLAALFRASFEYHWMIKGAFFLQQICHNCYALLCNDLQLYWFQFRMLICNTNTYLRIILKIIAGILRSSDTGWTLSTCVAVWCSNTTKPIWPNQLCVVIATCQKKSLKSMPTQTDDLRNPLKSKNNLFVDEKSI